MSRLEGKVALITGAARGLGRSHAVALANEGADILAVDICAQIDSVPYAMATEDDLRETAQAVEATGRRVVTAKADVRDYAGLKEAIDAGVSELGRLDIVCANAGIFSLGAGHELSPASWNDVIDTNVTGAWHTAKAAGPHLSDAGGSIVFTGAGNVAPPAASPAPGPLFSHYAAANYAVVGLMKSLALELAERGIRVNTLLPGAVDTTMATGFRDLTLPSARYAPSDPPAADAKFLQPGDVSKALVYLVSDEASHVTGAAFPVMGTTLA